MGLRNLVYRVYQRRLMASLPSDRLPKHVAVMIDGNRRWARAFGEHPSRGHQAGADKIPEFLGWCDELSVDVATIYMLSTDNLSRPADEVEPLLEIISEIVGRMAETRRWRIHPVGALDLVPENVAHALKQAEEQTSDVRGMLVNVAVGYGGRREVADAVRSLLHEHASKGTTIEELAEVIDVEHIAEHLYTKGQPDPDLIIRASGVQRLSDFLLWQSAYSEFFFCEALWPDFRKVDFLRAIRAYAARSRRYGR
ncbi:undecaprenyl diphosphate synthase family protein [Flindersiella endophytica]